MISLPSFMFKSRSCHCASLREGVRGNEVLTDLSWQRQFLFLGARGHNSDSSCPFRDSTGDSMGTRQQARRTDQTWLHLITRKASQLRWDMVGRTPLLLQCLPSPPWQTCTSRSYASCIHVWKKTQPSQNGLKHRPTHKKFSVIFSASYGSLCWPIKEKTLCTHNTHIREPFLTALWWEIGIKNRHWKHLNKKLSSISYWSQILHWHILQGQMGGEKKGQIFQHIFKTAWPQRNDWQRNNHLSAIFTQ